MVAIVTTKFGGEAPAVLPYKLPDHMAQVARNCLLQFGDLRPLRGTAYDSTLTKPGTIRSIFQWAPGVWFHWTDDVDVVRAPVISNTTGRVYYTGDVYPKATDSSIATVGGTDYPTNAYRLGVPAPLTAPTATADTATTCNVEDQLNVSFVYTYVSAWGEEGPPSYPSQDIAVCTGQTVTVSGMDTAPSGNYNIALKRVYAAIDGDYQYVGEVAVTATTFSFVFDPGNLGRPIETTEWDAPPDGMVGLTVLPSGVLAGFEGNNVLLSLPSVPHAFPTDYVYPTDYPIVGLAATGNALIVLTEGTPYRGIVTDPSMVVLDRIEVNQACVSKRSIVDMGYYVLYASPDGLIRIDANGAVKNVTEGIFTRYEWRNLNPASISAYMHEGTYVAFYETATEKRGFVYDPFVDGVTFVDMHATAGYNDLEDDQLYLVVGSDIVKWRESDPLTYVWRSKVYETPQPMNFGAMRIRGEIGTVKVTIWADEEERFTADVPTNEPFRLPSGFLASRWEYQLEGVATIRQVVMAEGMAEVRGL